MHSPSAAAATAEAKTEAHFCEKGKKIPLTVCQTFLLNFYSHSQGLSRKHKAEALPESSCLGFLFASAAWSSCLSAQPLALNETSVHITRIFFHSFRAKLTKFSILFAEAIWQKKVKDTAPFPQQSLHRECKF